MNAELKAKWIEALRSGAYRQGIASFERDGKYCCLGVLCVVADQPPVQEIGIGNWRFAESVLADDRREASKLSTDLSIMNDNGHSFKEIADYIEREF